MGEWGRREYSKAWPSRTPVWTWMALLLTVLFFAGMLTLEYERSWTGGAAVSGGLPEERGAGPGIILGKRDSLPCRHDCASLPHRKRKSRHYTTGKNRPFSHPQRLHESLLHPFVARLPYWPCRIRGSSFEVVSLDVLDRRTVRSGMYCGRLSPRADRG